MNLRKVVLMPIMVIGLIAWSSAQANDNTDASPDYAGSEKAFTENNVTGLEAQPAQPSRMMDTDNNNDDGLNDNDIDDDANDDDNGYGEANDKDNAKDNAKLSRSQRMRPETRQQDRWSPQQDRWSQQQRYSREGSYRGESRSERFRESPRRFSRTPRDTYIYGYEETGPVATYYSDEPVVTERCYTHRSLLHPSEHLHCERISGDPCNERVEKVTYYNVKREDKCPKKERCSFCSWLCGKCNKRTKHVEVTSDCPPATVSTYRVAYSTCPTNACD